MEGNQLEALLPEGFDETLKCFEPAMTAKVMRAPKEDDPEWVEQELSAVVAFSSTSCADALCRKSAWVVFMQAVAQDAKLITLRGPQNDDGWGKV